jgi:membrane protease YdiL (CAAX protease family)
VIVNKGAKVRQYEAPIFQRFLVLRLIVSFLLVKLVLAVFSEGWLAQLFVPLLLVTIAFGSGGKSLWSNARMMFQSPPDWGDGLCLAFFITPILMNMAYLTHASAESFTLWRLWLMSSSALFSVLFAPIAEEIFFRGWLLQQQLSRCSGQLVPSASSQLKIIYLNSLAFWLMHAPIDPAAWRHSLSDGFVPLSPGPFLLGLVATAFTLKTGNMRAAILFHAIANSQGPLWWPLLKQDWVRQLFYQ